MSVHFIEKLTIFNNGQDEMYIFIGEMHIKIYL